MRYLIVEEVLALHSRLIATSGGTQGVRDQNAPRFCRRPASDDIRRCRPLYNDRA